VCCTSTTSTSTVWASPPATSWAQRSRGHSTAVALDDAVRVVCRDRVRILDARVTDVVRLILDGGDVISQVDWRARELARDRRPTVHEQRTRRFAIVLIVSGQVCFGLGLLMNSVIVMIWFEAQGDLGHAEPHRPAAMGPVRSPPDAGRRIEVDS